MDKELRILILEDVPTDAELVKRELKKAEIAFTSRHVETRDSFLKELEDFSPDIVLSDYMMPQFTGREALELVKERYPSIPLIIVTGSMNEETAVECMKAGAVDYVIKENLTRLGQAVVGALEKKKLKEQKEKAEKKVREKERYFRSLIHSMHEDIIVINRDYVITDVNHMFLQTAGRTREEVIGKCCHEVSHGYPEPCNRYGEQCMLREVFKTGEPSSTHHVHTRADGSKAYVDIIHSAMKDEAGNVTQVIENVRDITDLMEAHEALRESERRYRTVLEANPDPVVVYDIEGKVTYFNPAFTRVFGWSFEERIGKKMDGFVPEKNWPETEMMIDKVLTGESFSGIESSRYTKEGKIIPVSISGAVYWDQEGKPIGSVVNLRDITEHKKLETQFRQAQKMEAIGVLAGGVAHDFNNILTVIIGNAELALMEVGKDDTLRKEIEEIKIAGERAAALTRQLLAFSRKQIIQPKILDLNELLTDMEKMLGRLIGEDVELLTIPGPELWQVEADPGQIEQVIMNFVVNAKDAMPMGGKLTVETTNVDLDKSYFREHGVKEEQPGTYVMLAVSDTGIGMDKETQEHIFEPFFTTKEIGKGTGLGLSTVYGIVKQNNGFVWVYSEPGQGTTFKVYLPKVKEDVEEEKKERTSVYDLGGSETVLIVEDDDSLRKLARTILKQRGYKVLEAENGEDALRVSDAHYGSIDLMITDVVMPKMGGKETAERLQPLYPQMKVIYMSGYTDDAIAHHGVLTPGLNFIEKPFPPEALTHKVREVLDQGN